MSSGFISDADMAELEKQGAVKTHAPAFISDEDFAKMESQGNHEVLKAGADHAGNTALLGYGPQIVGGLTKAALWADDKIHGTHNAELVPYSKLRDDTTKDLDQEEKDHPVASGVGTLAGALVGGAPLAALAPIEGASLGVRAAKAAGVAGAMGAISNPGDTEGEVNPLQLKERAQNAALSAALGAGLHTAGEGVQKLGGALADKLRNYASEKGFDALRPFKRAVMKNDGRTSDIGRTALDQGVIGWMPKGAEALAESAEEAKASSGAKLGDFVDELAKKGEESGVAKIKRKAIADKLREKLLSDAPLPSLQRRNQYYSGLIDEFEKGGEDLGLKDVRNLKLAVGGDGQGGKEGFINWKRLPGADIPEEEQFHRALYSELAGAENESANAVDQAVNGQGSNRFQTQKQQYGNLKTASNVAADRASSDRANLRLGLRDAIAGGAGATAGAFIGDKLEGPDGAWTGAKIGGTVGALGSKFSARYGSQVAAKGADALSKFLAQSPRLAALVNQNPAIASSLTQSLLRQNETAPQSQDQITPKMLDQIKQKPELLEAIKNPALRASIQKQLGKTPGSEQSQIIPEDEAKRQFVQGN